MYPGISTFASNQNQISLICYHCMCIKGECHICPCKAKKLIVNVLIRIRLSVKIQKPGCHCHLAISSSTGRGSISTELWVWVPFCPPTTTTDFFRVIWSIINPAEGKTLRSERSGPSVQFWLSGLSRNLHGKLSKKIQRSFPGRYSKVSTNHSGSYPGSFQEAFRKPGTLRSPMAA